MAKKNELKKPFSIKSVADAKKALERMEEIEAEISPLMKEATDLKVAATEFAVKKKVDAIQLDGVYFRQINRATRMWIAEPDDMPESAPSKAKSLREICKGITVKVKGKKIPLWQAITKRVPDPELIDKAVSNGWIDEDEIHKAYLEKPQKPFLQRYVGEAEKDG
jgi:hypothetical protein